MSRSVNITSVLHEDRLFQPPKEFAQHAHFKSMAQYKKMYRESIESPEKFWGRQAKQELVWFKPWKKVLQWKAPFAKWFVGGQLNVAYNCLDMHLNTPRANKAALIWEGEPAGPGKPGEERVLTYRQLHREVCRFANVLKRNGIQKGRPRHHLPADGAGGRHRHAGLRANWGGAFRGVRRVQRPRRRGSHL